MFDRKQYQRDYAREKRKTPEGKKRSALAWAKHHAKNPYKRRHQLMTAAKKHRLKKFYGLTVEQYDALAQHGCMICGSHDFLCVDHDHKANKVRGILCDDCNLGLGRFKDDTVLLGKAAVYLVRI